jgi:hypothetical protein
MLDLPLAVRLAIWAAALARGDADVEAAVRAVQGDDEPHTVTGNDVAPDGDLTVLLRWVGHTADDVGVVLPEPGHALGLPGPPALNNAALDAGECVLVSMREPARVQACGLVPEVERFGSWLEPGVTVDWVAYNCPRPRVVDLGSLSDAERALREAMQQATEALAALDIARWREDAADRIAVVRDGGLGRGVVPAGHPPRALRVLASAARVRAIVELARQDDGAAVTGWEAGRRDAALRDVDQVARRAMVAAVNLPA